MWKPMPKAASNNGLVTLRRSVFESRYNDVNLNLKSTVPPDKSSPSLALDMAE